MIQLIKQVLKSFKNSILLLFGLVFIAFSIIFSSTSSLYFASNVSNSYQTLKTNSNAEDAILESGDDQLNNFNLLNNIYDLSLFTFENNSLEEFKQHIRTPNENGNYFETLQEYNDITTSFVYQPAQLSKLKFKFQDNTHNYIFPYYVDMTQANAKNPFYQAEGINDESQMFIKRAPGILKSYGYVPIPNDYRYWRAQALEFRSIGKPEYITYEIDPKTGLTKNPENGLYKSYGYFNGGLLSKSLNVFVGNLKYPNGAVLKPQSEINADKTTQIFNVDIKNVGIKNNNQPINSPFFVSKESLNPKIDFDLAQYGSIGKIIEMIKNGADALNILSSTNVTISYELPLVDFDWNAISIHPFRDYINILHNQKYITESTKASFVDGNKNVAAINQNDLVFNIHVNLDNLTKLQKETLEYVKQIDEEAYSNLVRFTYSVNSSWIKSELDSLYGNIESYKTAVNNKNFDKLEDLITPLEFTNNSEKVVVSPISKVESWINVYANSKQQEFLENIKIWEKRYLSSKLNEIDNAYFYEQKSYTITDAETSNNYLVSMKDEWNDNKYLSNDINKLFVTSGTKLYDSTKYLDVIDYLFDQTQIEKNKIPVDTTTNWSINPSGNYLINLVNLVSKSEIIGLNKDSIFYKKVKKLSSKIIDNYKRNRSIDPNEYYELFAIVSIYGGPKNKIISTDNQNLEIKTFIKEGITPLTYFGSIKYATPYGHAAVVTDKWLSDNKKSIVPVDEWKKALTYDSPEFLDWAKNVPDSQSITINSRKFLIIGTGQSAENAFPIVSLDKPIPNSKTEGLLFVNKQGYESILDTVPSTYQNEYFAIKFKDDLKSLSSKLNAINYELKDLIVKNAYLASDTDNNKNVLTLRYSYPTIIKSYVQLGTTILTIILIIIGVYLCYLMIKIYVDKNQTSLAIIKANGMSNWKIVIALSLFGLFIAIISGSLGYIATYFMQSIFLQIISNYWFIPIVKHNFSAIGFVGGGTAIYLAFAFFVFIGILILFKQPINSIISKNTDIKINKLLYVFKGTKFKLPVMAKFTFSMIINKIGKFALFIGLCSTALSIISVGVASPLKFSESRVNTENNRKYDYSFELETPTQQSGLYRIQDKEMVGISDKSIGIGGIYEGAIFNKWSDKNLPYTDLFNQTDLTVENNRDLFALRDNDGKVIIYENGEKKYFDTLLLPSYTANSLSKSDINFFRNSVFTKWLLDFDINVLSLSLNAWDLVKQTLSSELVSRIDLISKAFVNKILENPKLKKANDIGSGTESDKKPFLVLDDGEYTINSDNVLTPIDISNLDSIRLNNSFMKFIGMVYGDEELSQLDTKFTYGIVPKGDETETFTYVEAILDNNNIKIPSYYNNGQRRFVNISQKIYGINPDSSYVNLVNDKNEFIGDKLKQQIDGFYPIIINKGAALKYNLDIGDSFDLKALNTYDRFSNNFFGSLNKNNTHKFKIVGISSDSFGVSFYTSQEFANQILRMRFEDGATLITNYKRIHSNDPANSWPNIENFDFDVIGDPNLLVTSNKYTVNVSDYKNLTNYIPFNGIFSKEQEPTLLSNLALQAKSGIWANYSKFSDSNFKSVITEIPENIAYNIVIPFDKDTTSKMKELMKKDSRFKDFAWTNDPRADIINALESITLEINKVSDISSMLEKVFGTNAVSISISSLEFFTATFETYGTIFNSFIVIQNILIAMLLPIIIVIVMIVSSVMINEYRKMLAILKTLGYSDKKNLKLIYLTFVPVLLISLIIGIVILALMIFSIQTAIFKLSTIYISSSINWMPYLYGAIAVISIIVINFIYISIYVKKQNLKNSIN